MKHATEKDLNDIMEVFKIHRDTFPHVRSDKIERMINEGNVIWEDEVVITYNHYKRSQRIGTYYRSARKGDCILHQIAAKNQGDGSAKKVFLRFLEYNKGKDVWLSVRAENKRAIAFYEKQNFESKYFFKKFQNFFQFFLKNRKFRKIIIFEKSGKIESRKTFRL